MKYLLLSCFLLLMPSLTFSQDQYDLSGLHGLKEKNGDLQFELGGYNIAVTTLSGKADDKLVVHAAKTKYKMGSVFAEYVDTEIDLDNKILEAESYVYEGSEIKTNQVCYILSKAENLVTVIFFQTLNQRDILLEQTFVDAFLYDGLVQHVSVDWAVDTISFAARDISLGGNCQWVSPHNVNCNGVQMSWSEFPSFESAMLDINARILANNSAMPILAESDIDVIFEDVPSVAHRVAYKQIDRESLGPLIVYYIVQEIRGCYMTCVMSYYGSNRNDYNLPSMFKQMMSIPQLPEEAYDPVDESQVEESLQEGKQYSIPMIDIQAGTKLPFGGLRNAFKTAPFIGLSLGAPIKSNMAIDLGLQFAIPVKGGKFDYYYKKEIYETKASFMANVNLRWRIQQELSKNLFWTTYLGAGVGIIQTDLEKEYYDDEESKYHTVDALDVFGGASIRHKNFGCFVEYHYTPYSMGNRVESRFGNSMLSVGLVYSFAWF